MKTYTKKIILGTAALTLGVVAISNLSLDTTQASYTQEGLVGAHATSVGDGAKTWWENKLMDSETGLPLTAEKMSQQRAAMQFSSKFGLPLIWEEKGPDNIGGRTRAIVIDRNNINNIYAGSVTGGLWKSTNGGNAWTKVSTFPGNPTISSACQTQDGTIFISTGLSSSIGEPYSGQGDGIFYSTDGVLWLPVPGTTTGFSTVREIVCASNSNKIYITGGSSLKTWTVGDAGAPVNAPAIPTGTTGAMAMSPDGTVMICQFGAKHYVTSNSGTSWTDVTAASSSSTTFPISNSGRTEYAVSSTQSGGAYHIYLALTSSNGRGFFKSGDNGTTWGRCFGATTSAASEIYNIYNNQGTYGSVVSVDGINPKKAFIGGIDVWSWTENASVAYSGQLAQKSFWAAAPISPVYVHADNHEMKWATASKLYIGNDGGVGISLNNGTTFYPANRGYNVTQFYSIGYDADGAVIGGAQDNGTLYNNYSNTTLQSFDEIMGGDGFDAEISHFNKNIIFSSIYYNGIERSSDGGSSAAGFLPIYPSLYGPTGSEAIGTATSFPFKTVLKLAEYYDLNSKDSVIFTPTQSYAVGDAIVVNSETKDATINYTVTAPIYFSDTVFRDMTLDVADFRIVGTTGNGTHYYLSELTATWPGSPATPVPGEVLTVSAPFVGTITVASILSVTHKFGKNTQDLSSSVYADLDTNQYILDYAWSKPKFQDPYQSILMVYGGQNGGELWATKDALRVDKLNPEWFILAQNIGSDPDIEVSEDLNHIFIAGGNKITRISNLGNIYSQESNYTSQVTYSAGVVGPGLTSQLVSISVSCIGIDPRNPDALIMGTNSPGSVRKCTSATTSLTTGTLLSTGPNVGAPIFDIMMDRDDNSLLVAATAYGVSTSSNGGTTWASNSAGFDNVPATKVKQQWRTFAEKTSRPGEIYVSTFGRGIFTSASVLGLSNPALDNTNAKQEVLNVYPNPTVNSSAIRFTLKEAGKVTVLIYSINGTLVKTIKTDNLEQGEQNIELDVENIQNGNYIVKAISGSHSATGRLVKM